MIVTTRANDPLITSNLQTRPSVRGNRRLKRTESVQWAPVFQNGFS